MCSPKNSVMGFTLVELSIVIVIVGLIVAGVTAGKSLVKQSQFRAIVTDASNYATAITSFKLQYNGLPGDLKNAQSYWPTSTNGSGNRILNYNAAEGNEGSKAWQHLALARLIPGVYDATSFPYIPGKNVPAGPVSQTLWCTGLPSVGQALFGVANVNWIQIGAISISNSAANCSVGFLSPAEAYGIDLKVDDGQASRGSVYSINDLFTGGSGITCTSGDHTGGPGNSNYQLQNSNSRCSMFFSPFK